MAKTSYFFITLAVLLAGVLMGWQVVKNEGNTLNLNGNNSKTENEKVLKEKIGQMIMVGFRGAEIKATSTIAKAIKELNLGGVILFDYDVPSQSFPRNILNPEQVKKLTTDLQNLSTTTLLIALDAEGGQINRLKEKYGFTNIPSHQKLGETGESNEVFKQATKLATQLKELGFNLNFAPVVDLNINPENPVIAKLERAFSADPLKVIELSRAFIKALQEQGIISVIKHFPGHGSSSEDSHLGLVDITATWQEKELLPYEQLMAETSLEPIAVMSGHLVNKNIDPNLPATLSPLWINNVLRGQIGFQGVVVSDDLQMGAIIDSFGPEETIIKAIEAGCDILLFSNNSSQPYDQNLAFKARQIIFEAVREGKISPVRIDQSWQRISQLKAFLHSF